MIYGLLKAYQFMLSDLYMEIWGCVIYRPEMIDSSRIEDVFDEILALIPSDTEHFTWEGDDLKDKLAEVQYAIDDFVDQEIVAWDALVNDEEPTLKEKVLAAIKANEVDTNPLLAYVSTCLAILLSMKVTVTAYIQSEVNREDWSIDVNEFESERDVLLEECDEFVPLLVERIKLPHLLLAYQHILEEWDKNVYPYIIGIYPKAGEIVERRIDELEEVQKLNERYSPREALERYTGARTQAYEEIMDYARQRVLEVTSAEEELEALKDQQLEKLMNPETESEGLHIYMSATELLEYVNTDMPGERLYLDILKNIETTMDSIVGYYSRQAEMEKNIDDLIDMFREIATAGRDRENQDNRNDRDKSDDNYETYHDDTHDKSYEGCEANEYDDNDDEDDHDEAYETHDKVSNHFSNDTFSHSDVYSHSTKKIPVPMDDTNSRLFPCQVITALILFVGEYDSTVGKSYLRGAGNTGGFFSKLLGRKKDPIDQASSIMMEVYEKIDNPHEPLNEEILLSRLYSIKEAVEPLLDGIVLACEDNSNRKTGLPTYYYTLQGGVESIYFAYRMGQVLDLFEAGQITDEDVRVEDMDEMFEDIYEGSDQGLDFCTFMRSSILISLGQLEAGVEQYANTYDIEPIQGISQVKAIVDQITDYFVDAKEGRFDEAVGVSLNDLMIRVEELEKEIRDTLEYDKADKRLAIGITQHLGLIKILSALYQEGMRHFFIKIAKEYNE